MHFGNNQMFKDKEDLQEAKTIPLPCTETTATLLPPKRGSELVLIKKLRKKQYEHLFLSFSLSLKTLKAMIGENRQLVTDEPVEFEK